MEAVAFGPEALPDPAPPGRLLPALGGLLAHPRRQALFAALSAADLSLTGWLLARPGGAVYEGNPVARWWLDRHGWPGLVAFKAAAVLLVLGLAAAIARRSPRAAGRVLGFGCVTVAAVVAYSGLLCGPAAGWRTGRGLQTSGGPGKELEPPLAEANAYRAVLHRAAEDVLAGECTLPDAARRLAETERGRDPAWLRTLAKYYPGRSPRECLAANLIMHAVGCRRERPRQAWRAALRLERAFESAFGGPAPRLHRDHLPGAGEGPAGGASPGPGAGAAHGRAL